VIKYFSKLGIEENFLNLIKDLYTKIYNEYMALDNEILSVISLPIGKNERYQSSLPVNIVREVLTNIIRQEK
jgi:hypothetical protein